MDSAFNVSLWCSPRIFLILKTIIITLLQVVRFEASGFKKYFLLLIFLSINAFSRPVWSENNIYKLYIYIINNIYLVFNYLCLFLQNYILTFFTSFKAFFYIPEQLIPYSRSQTKKRLQRRQSTEILSGIQFLKNVVKGKKSLWIFLFF